MNPFHSGGPPNWMRQRPPHQSFNPPSFPVTHQFGPMQPLNRMCYGGPGPPNPADGNVPFNTNEDRPRNPNIRQSQMNTGMPAFEPRPQGFNQQMYCNPNFRPEFGMNHPSLPRFLMFSGPNRHNGAIRPWTTRQPFKETVRHHFEGPPNMPMRHQFDSQSSSLSRITAVSNVQNKDRELVKTFLSSIGKLPIGSKSLPNKGINSPVKQSITISEAQKLLSRATELIKTLEETSESTCESIQKMKGELSKILLVIKDPEVVKNLETKITQRRKSRMRKKLKKRKAFEQINEEKQRIEVKNKIIEEWQKQENTKLDQQLREAEMQKQIDEALGEVRKEQATTSKAIEMVSFLAKLRKIRFNARKTRGEEVPDEAVNKQFEQTVKRVKGELLTHKTSCEKKAAALRLFMETEQEEAKLAIESKRRKKEVEKQTNWKIERETILFGKPVEVNAFDPMWPVQELHKQGNLTLENLIQYRQMWDQYLDPSGTSLPVDWTEPVEPSSVDWGNTLSSSSATDGH